VSSFQYNQRQAEAMDMIETALQVPGRIPETAAPFRTPATQHVGAGAVERVGEEARRAGA
jgi:hypothetical protein